MSEVGLSAVAALPLTFFRAGNFLLLGDDSQSRFFITVSPENAEVIEAKLGEHALTRIGTVTDGDRLAIACGDGEVDASLAELKAAWQKPLGW